METNIHIIIVSKKKLAITTKNNNIMTKEEIINAVLNLNVTNIEDINGYPLFNNSLLIFESAILSVCSKGVVVIYENAGEYRYTLTLFEDIKKITYSKTYSKTVTIE